jgi:ABC-type multidrug transport system ATPase subunit
MNDPASLTPATEAVIPLQGVTVLGREPALSQVLLPHPQVSRTHACVVLQGKAATLTDLNSANGTFVNGQRVTAAVRLQPGDDVDIGPYAFQFTGTSLIRRPRSDNVELVAQGVCRVARDRETGGTLTLLDDVTLAIRPHEFVCLLGPSGSGKSTLLSVLGGRTAPDEGVVLLNGRGLHRNFEAVKQDIALVPQKDVLHDALTVGEALWYTAKLRLPPDTTAAELEARLGEVLATVGLAERRDTTIRHLSGGQVKRASLANEILCKPSLLLLDEVTSGLDEQTDREVMRLLRALADAGKTVVCVTHSLANVERACHRLVILAPGGKLAFVGTPAEALAYFRVERLGDVYDRLLSHQPEQWQQAFLASPLWRRHVGGRLPKADAEPQLAVVRKASPPFTTTLRLFARQTVLLTRRYAAIWRGDFLSLGAMALQALVVAVLLVMLFGDLGQTRDERVRAQSTSNLVFLLAVTSFWFGCNNAAKEIVKERTIYTRERDFNVRVGSYYTSKLLLLCGISCLQTVMLFVIVRHRCALPGAYLGELAVLLALAVDGVTLGLAISAVATTEEMAITLIPMTVIPQIILSGSIAPLEGWSKALAGAFVSTYWGKRALDAALPTAVAQAMVPPLEQQSAFAAAVALVLHAAAAVALALGALWLQNRRLRGFFRKG